MGLTRLSPGTCCGCATTAGCGSCSLPTTLHLTDDAGTVTLTYDGISAWHGCQTISVASAVSQCDCFNVAAPTGGGSILIRYQMSTSLGCYVQRTWPICDGPTCYYCVDSYSGCNIVGVNCTGPYGPGYNVTCPNSAIDSGTLSSCTLPISMTLTLGSSACTNNTLVSPFATGNITIQS